uniref:Alpha-1,6-mannosyl-glycoprotein 2-beta-N-acetylglucosaminyltransferase n=2 Tax=Acrobeloides nanus TaxID=290746 RepID=A0A914C8Q3_9BILA
MASYQGIQEQQPSAISSAGKGNKSKPKGDDLEDWRKLFISPVGMDQIVESINFLNSHHEVLNVNKFGPVNTSTVVIVVQVHERIEYLKYVISTLEKTRGIENALLVFSHDLSFEPINQLIRSIQFCRVIQIFYPYNIQIFSNTYPGQDPDDCPERISKDEAKSMGCNNWEFPDKYGHYRVAKVTQIKHHWWWKMNYVFDGIMAKYNLNTYVILLEEDHYVSPDFLHVFNLMIEHKKEFCDDCRVLCLGTYLKNYKNFQNDIDRLGVHPWFSSKYNMGMAINRETWDLIRNCSNFFCTYDDYNWDWTLLQVSLKCMPSKMRVIFAKAPRVMHIGDCGVHTHKCQPHDAAEKARSLFSQHNNSLFPTSLHVTDNSKRMLKPSKPNGGWGDVRDHKLCEANSFPLKVDPTLPLKAAVLHEVSDAVLSPPQTPLYNASKITKVDGVL